MIWKNANCVMGTNGLTQVGVNIGIITWALKERLIGQVSGLHIQYCAKV